MPYFESLCSDRIENAIRFRPNYPHQLIEYLYTEGGYSRESVIAEIGSKTGAFTRLLLERGSRVVAIEPDDLLRIAAERLLSDEFQRFVSIKGTASNTTLCDASIHHIVCAHPIHWKDLKECRSEFFRILKPAGSVTIIWNSTMVGADAFTKEYERLVQSHLAHGERTSLHRLELQELADFFGTPKHHFISVPNHQILDLEGVKGRLLADEDFLELGEEERNAMMKELHSLFDRYSQSGKVVLCYETEAYTSQFDRG